MKEQAIPRTIDIPDSLYRKLKAQAAAQGRSIGKFIILGVHVTLLEGKRSRAPESEVSANCLERP